MISMKKRIVVMLTATTLAIGLTVPATASDISTIGVSSYKGNTLKIGERSGLIISPSDTEYTVTTSDPETVAVEQVLTFWGAVAKTEGSAEITVSNSTGEYGNMTLTVNSAAPTTPEIPSDGDSTILTDNLEIR